MIICFDARIKNFFVLQAGRPKTEDGSGYFGLPSAVFRQAEQRQLYHFQH